MRNELSDIVINPSLVEGLLMQFQVPVKETWDLISLRPTGTSTADAIYIIRVNEIIVWRCAHIPVYDILPVFLTLLGGSFVSIHLQAFAGIVTARSIAIHVDRKEAA